MNGIPHDKGELRCQAVGGNAEGKVPTTAPVCASESREGIRPPGSDAASNREGGGGGGFVDLPLAEEKYNGLLSDRRGGNGDA